jgi:hypothetical protein
VSNQPKPKTISQKDREWLAWLIAVALIVVGTVLGVNFPQLPPMPQGAEPQALAGGYTNLSGLVVAGPTTFATATPAAIVDSLGLGTILEIRDATTPVAYYANGGGYTGSQAHTVNNQLAVSAPTAIATANPALLVSSAGLSQIASFRDGSTELLGIRNGGSVVISAPTAQATAVPGLIVDSSGKNVAAEVRIASTPMWYVNSSGGWYAGGNGYSDGRLTLANVGLVSAPTAVATATPAWVVDSLAVSNPFEVRAASTPVFAVQADGDVVGNVLSYGTAGETAVAATASITTTGTVDHGLSTVTWAVCTLAQDADDDAGDTASISVSISTNVVTVKAWQDDATAATDTDVDVNCLIIGTP